MRTTAWHRSGPRRRRSAAALVASMLVITTAAGCADFSSSAPTFGPQPSLTQPAPTPVEPGAPPRSSAPESSSSSAAPSSSSAPADPCVPTDAAVIAACLESPWGLAVLPDGQSALVGERTTGKILLVAPKEAPVEIAVVPDLDHSGSGGLLGLALSPAYTEDGLIYVYATTATDNRILRIAAGDPPKAIFTSIPKGAVNNGGQIAFGPDGLLYIGTGDTGVAALSADGKSLAGKVLRLDEFGKPAVGPDEDSPILARGFTNVGGMCELPDGTVAALDNRKTADVLLRVKQDRDYTKPQSGDTVWTWKKSAGGAADCTMAGPQLVNTSLENKNVMGVTMTPQGGFTGAPEELLDSKYGRLLTAVTGGSGEQQLIWMTTSNKDGKGNPVPADDRVIVLPAGAGGGDGGAD